MKPAVFFDRDGTLNIEKDYLFKKEDFEWIPGAVNAIGWLKQKGFMVFVVTNQSGIARGYYSVGDMEKLHDFMQQELLQEGFAIDAFYYCPHHPDIDGDCFCRKPQPGMILKAMKDHDIDKEKSFLIGDKDRDVKAAENAGIRGYLYQGGDIFAMVKEIVEKQDKDAENL